MQTSFQSITAVYSTVYSSLIATYFNPVSLQSRNGLYNNDTLMTLHVWRPGWTEREKEMAINAKALSLSQFPPSYLPHPPPSLIKWACAVNWSGRTSTARRRQIDNSFNGFNCSFISFSSRTTNYPANSKADYKYYHWRLRNLLVFIYIRNRLSFE